MIDCCENRVEEEIFYLYTRIMGIQQARKKTKLTHQLLEEDLYNLTNMLIIRLESYLDARPEQPGYESIHYTSTSREYSDSDKDKFKEFHSKYKDYRDKRLCHYNESVAISDVSLTISEIEGILKILFKSTLRINNFNAEIFFSYPLVALKMFESDSSEERTLPFLVSLNKAQRHDWLAGKDLIIKAEDIKRADK